MLSAGSAFLSILILALLIRRVIQNRTKLSDGVPRPPLLPNWLPFIGSAMSMTKGDTFWVAAERSQGPVFRILALGGEKVFTTDPGVISWVYRNAKTCDFPWIRKHLLAHSWGMKRSVAFSDIWDDIFAAHHRALSPEMLSELNGRYVDHLEKTMDKRVRSLNQKERVSLTDWVFEVMYTASSQAFFSSSFPVDKTIGPFKAFDKAFPLLVLETLPSFMVAPARKTITVMHELLLEWWNDVRMNPKVREVLAPSLMSMMNVGEEDGWSDGCMMSTALGELWALEANAPYGGMWTLLEIARRPKLYAMIHDEIVAATRDLSPPSVDSLMRLDQPELVARCPQLNAAYQETLRFHTESFSMRKVMDPITIPSNLIQSGPGAEIGLRLEQDDQIVCVTRTSAISPESDWGPTAGTWDYTRFLKTGSRKEQMWPFGGGVSMCEGRHFASIEILTFLISFISSFKISIISDDITEDRTRIGLGILQPKGHAVVELSRR